MHEEGQEGDITKRLKENLGWGAVVKDSFSLGCLTVLDVSQAYTCVEIVKMYTLNSTFVHLSMYKLYTLNMFP